VRVPDLYDGRTLTSTGDGFEFQKSVSGEELADAAAADEFFAEEGDIDAAREIGGTLGPRLAELCVYPGDQHLFPDRSLPSNDAGAAALLTQRVVAFLDRF
jgi:dienelactone hydrolase